MDNYLKIAILDDGVNENIFPVNKLLFDLEVSGYQRIKQVKHNYSAHISHGTVCAAVIQKNTPTALFGSIKILDKRAGGKANQLLTAISWCIEEKIKIIHMSLGSIDFRDYNPLVKKINQAFAAGIITIAAADNRDIITFPASFANTIGVKADRKNILKEGEITHCPYPADGIDFIASSSHRLIDTRGTPVLFHHPANSFAAPVVTARCYNILREYPGSSFFALKKKLIIGITKKQEAGASLYFQNRLEWLESAEVVNFTRKTFSCGIPAVKNGITAQQIKNLSEYQPGTETVILLNDFPHPSATRDEIRLMMDSPQLLSKNIIVIDDQSLPLDPEKIIPRMDVKIFYPAMLSYFNQSEIELRENDSPRILIQSPCKESLLKILVALTGIFKKKGFYAVAAANLSRCALFGCEYLAFTSKNPGALPVLFSTHYADIFLIGIFYDNNQTYIPENLASQINAGLLVTIPGDSKDTVTPCAFDVKKTIGFVNSQAQKRSCQKSNPHHQIVKNVNQLYRKIRKIYPVGALK